MIGYTFLIFMCGAAFALTVDRIVNANSTITYGGRSWALGYALFAALFFFLATMEKGSQ